MCSGRKDGTLDQWLARMNETPLPQKRPVWVEWVMDGHGHLLDPKVDQLDEAAQRMLNSQNAS